MSIIQNLWHGNPTMSVSNGETSEYDRDILSYWRDNQSRYPTLARAAKSLLSVPASSTPSERIFSLGRIVLSEWRNRLSPEKTKHLMCLNKWMGYGDSDDTEQSDEEVQ